jgi:hypothetical protein
LVIEKQERTRLGKLGPEKAEKCRAEKQGPIRAGPYFSATHFSALSLSSLSLSLGITFQVVKETFPPDLTMANRQSPIDNGQLADFPSHDFINSFT